eukprot:TRINITY_DN3999_c0_g2_i2.p1 TRINITY_DN3999_c0_g2~~TRINITY_DN3999_c0_g2_i2.p1  ORF type:complete len:442 (-),score=85.91 TRINITY_DN3999_c0_g2_i2:582-1907(-)
MPAGTPMEWPGYQGDMVNGVPHGYGSITFSNGNRFEGEWQHGLRRGFGKYFYSNGSKYEGEVYDGHLHGKGTLTFANGNHYEGEFRQGKREGKGVFTWHDGEKYEGGFKNDKRHGYGIYFYANKDVYKGRFANGLKHGNGTYYYSNEDKYDGQFVQGQRHGTGVLFFSNGDKYEGEFKGDKQNGLGMLEDANGNKYEGKFKNDKKHGDGIAFVKEDGSFMQQKWKNGVLINEYKITSEEELARLKQGLSSKLFEQREIVIYDRALPYKVAMLIFSFLDAKPLCRSSRVCKSWKKLAKSNALWEQIVKRKWNVSSREVVKNWKRLYQCKMRPMSGDVMPKGGMSSFIFKNGNVYEGEWLDGLRHGYGRMLYMTNTNTLDSFVESFEGDWKKGKKHGTGIYVWSNGDIYEGRTTEARLLTREKRAGLWSRRIGRRGKVLPQPS